LEKWLLKKYWKDQKSNMADGLLGTLFLNNYLKNRLKIKDERAFQCWKPYLKEIFSRKLGSEGALSSIFDAYEFPRKIIAKEGYSIEVESRFSYFY
jgi:hypothetical protein